MRNNNNKLFVNAMIITAIIGLTALMVTMFIGIKFFTEKNELPHEDKVSLPVESPQVEISSTILGVVTQISDEGIKLFDIEKKQTITAKVAKTTKVQDAYNQTIPIASIEQGNIVEIVYEPQKDMLINIRKTTRGWEKSDVNSVNVIQEKNSIRLDQKEYTYGRDTLILDKKGEKTTIENVGDHDKLVFTGVGERIWSIRVMEKQGQVILAKLPTLKGNLEIDTNRIISLEDIKDSVYISPGKHKIVLNMQGYEPIVEDVEVVSGSNVKITAEGAKIAYTDVVLTVAGGVSDYVVDVNNKKYKPREAIKLEQGTYTFKITADGYKPWAMQLDISGSTKTLQAVLTPNSPKPTDGPTQTNQTEGEAANYQISISTDPLDADVYIGGIHKGKTPYKTTLPVGDYKVELKKEGYETYTTSLIIDNSDNQNSYQYVLTPIQ